MIPRRLALKNFLSYGDRVEPIDFSSLHVACLAGDNGNGKSALLDAITWCLWGRARASTDELVRLGQVEMAVEFEFEFEGTVYRAIRKRDLSRRGGTSDLQLQVLDPATAAFRSLTGVGIRETEAKIVEVLRMDYETFINSAFLLQGRADEFTQRTPAERKKILGEILGLSVFDDLEARARAKRQVAHDALAAVERRIQELEAAVAGRDVAVAERGALDGQLAALEAALADDEARLSAGRAERVRLDQAAREGMALAERIAEAARRAEEADGRAARLATRVAAYEATLADAPRIEAGLARLRALRAEEQTLAGRLLRERELAERRAALERAIAEARSQLEVRRARAAEALASLKGRFVETEGLLASRGEVEAGLAALRAAEADEQAMAARLDETLQLTGRIADLERQVVEAETAVKLERERLATRLADATRRAEGLEVARARMAALDGQLTALEGVARKIEEVQEKGMAAKAKLDAIPERLARLDDETSAVEARLAQLGHAGSDCPLCEQPLPAERRQAMVERLAHEELAPRRAAKGARLAEQSALEAEVRRLRDEWTRLGRELAAREPLRAERAKVAAAAADAEAAREVLAALEAAVAAVDARLAAGAASPELRAALAEAGEALAGLEYERAAHDTLRGRIAALRPFEARQARVEHAAREAASLAAEIPSAEAAVAALDAQLADGTFAEAHRSALAALEAEAAEVVYDPSAHAALRAELAEHEPFERLAVELTQAGREVTEARSAEAEARAAAESARAEGGRLTVERAARLEEAARLPALEQELAAHEAGARRRREEERELRQRLGQVQARLADLDRQADELTARRAEARDLAETRQTYTDLARVFGKNGVQAIIIENAIPEIEEEANRLLGRLTDHAMRLKLETQRDKKTGGVAETLEIRIADELGTRPYECFSGGEAFRVNFALRIALSRLLARRAGAKLQTLVIDEGFGTQDGRGMAKLVEAIRAVEADFAKILVITHIEELKGAFPSRIEVEKDPVSGSTCRVV
jgi:exonuclease SbcC